VGQDRDPSPQERLAERVRDRRVELRLTQNDLAKRVGRSLRWVTDLENGRGDPTLFDLKAIADVLEKSVAWLLHGLFEGHRSVTGGAVAGNLGVEVPGDTRRRTFLGYLATLAGDPAAVAELGDKLYVAEMSHVTDTLMDSWYTATPRSLLGAVTGHLSALQALLPGIASLRAELASTTGRVALLRGHALIKLNRTGQAYGDLALAETLAREAGDGNLLALILAMRSGMFSTVSLGVRAGDPRRAIAELDEAVRHSSLLSPPLLLVAIHARRAEERAAASDHSGAQDDLEQASKALAMASDEEPSVFGARDVAELDAVRGFILTLLGQHGAAVDVLDTAMANMKPSLVAWRAAVLADQGAALAQHAEIDEACERLHRALDLAEQSSAADHWHRVVGVRRLHLAAHSSAPAVRQLDDRLGLPLS